MTHCDESSRPTSSAIPLWTLIVTLGCALLAGCQPTGGDTKEPASADTHFPIRIGDKTLQLQLAITQAEQQKGLMFRKELAPDHGMLFLSERPRKHGFWMKSTSLPLDIGYFDTSGRLLEVHKLFPFDETTVASRSEQVLIAVETNRDWYKKNEISPGAQLDMDALKSAITERGFSPAAYLIED